MSIKEILENSIVLITSSNEKNASFGTGFVFWQEGCDSYILTCEHVIEEVLGDKEKKGNVCIGSITDVEIVARGDSKHIDLTVLKVSNLGRQELNVFNLYGLEKIDFQIRGFYREGTSKNPIIGKNIKGKTINDISVSTDVLYGWELSIKKGNELRKGYSGSPIIDKKTQQVFAVATHAEGSGSGGYAISIHHVLKIWQQAPIELRNLLNKSVANRQDLSDIDCHLLIEFLRDREKHYTVKALLAYPPNKFENIFVEDIAINFGDENITTNFVTKLLTALDQKVIIDHNKLTLEFILPIELFSEPIEQWIDESDNPIGAFYPIVIRSQERLKRQELKRLWKQIQPDLEIELSNKTYWLEHPNAKKLYQNLKNHVCFAMQFNPYIEKSFLPEMLKYGVAVGLWSCNCQDFAIVQNQIKNEIIANKKLSDLPNAIKEFRTNQWVNENCDYHLTLFWDDKDSIPPSYQLQQPSSAI